MFNPFVFTLNLQRVVLRNCLQMSREHYKALQPPPYHHRCDDLGTAKPNVKFGAALDDHYGHRAHDVDVEHI